MKVKVTGQKFWNKQEDFPTSKIFPKKVKDKISLTRPKLGYDQTGLTTSNAHCNMNAVSRSLQELWPRSFFFKIRSKVEVKITITKLVPTLMSVAPLHTLSKLYDVPVCFVVPPFIWDSVLLYLRSPKGGCCSISDDRLVIVNSHLFLLQSGAAKGLT